MEWFLHFPTLWKNWAKKKTIKKHKMSKFSCVHSVQILNATIHLEVEPKYTHIAQFNECDDSSSIDCWIFEPLIMFFQCALSLSFSLSISFCLFSVSGSVLYSEKFPSILHHSSAEASIFLLGGWKMLLSLVHMQSSVYCVYKIYSNSWKFPSVLPYLFYFLRVAKLIYEFKFCYKTLTKMERSFKWSLHLCKSMCMYFVIQNSILGKYVDAMVVPCAKFKLIEKIESKS